MSLLRMRAIARGVAVLAVAGCSHPLPSPHTPIPSDGDEFLVHFIAVGPGDAILLEIDGGPSVLVDGGKSEDNLAKYLEEIRMDTLDLVVLTHSDHDHWGGLQRVIAEDAVEVMEFWTPGFTDTSVCRATRAYRDFERMVRNSVDDTEWPRIGTEREWSEGDVTLRLKVLAGNPSPESRLNRWGQFRYGCPYRLNDASAVLVAEFEKGHKTWRFLLTGDINGKAKGASWTDEPIEGEAHLLERWPGELAADVLKLPHHGSNTSNTHAFLNAVFPPHGSGPRFAVVQENKPYFGQGPPAQSTLDHFRILEQRRDVHLLRNADHVYCYVPKGKDALTCRHHTKPH